MAQIVKNLPAMWNVGDLGSISGLGRSLGNEMATHSSIPYHHRIIFIFYLFLKVTVFFKENILSTIIHNSTHILSSWLFFCFSDVIMRGNMA